MKDIFDPDPASPEARRLDTRREAQIDKNFHFCFLLINNGSTFMETILLTFLREYCPRPRRIVGGKHNFTSFLLTCLICLACLIILYFRNLVCLVGLPLKIPTPVCEQNISLLWGKSYQNSLAQIANRNGQQPWAKKDKINKSID